MRRETYVCDNCARDRSNDSNSWFSLWIHDEANDVVCIGPFNPKLDTYNVHACGRDCAFGMLERFLATGSFERRPVTMKYVSFEQVPPAER